MGIVIILTKPWAFFVIIMILCRRTWDPPLMLADSFNMSTLHPQILVTLLIRGETITLEDVIDRVVDG